VALLPNLAQSQERIFRLNAPYRVDDELAIEILDDAAGRLHLTLLGYEGHFPTKVLWSGEVDYDGSATLRYRAGDGAICLDDATLGTMPLPSLARRFCWDFRLSLSGVDRERRTSHYLSRPRETIGRDYFEGGNYVDHAAETVGQSERILALMADTSAVGPVLLLNTSNADSLCHRVFGQEWEGYFDGSHYGIDQVSVASVRRELAVMGWRIERLETDTPWDGSADPLHATLRDWWNADARFRQLLVEKELGDFLLCVAVKT